MIEPITDDNEIRAILLMQEAFALLENNPRAVRRVVDYIGSRHLESLKDDLARLDAEIKVVNERLAYQKYGQLPESLRTPKAIVERAAASVSGE